MEKMEKGIYYIVDAKSKAPFLWKNDKFWTEKEIEYYGKNGKPMEKDLALLLPVFSESWMALQYKKRHSLKNILVGLVTEQSYWSYILNILKNNEVKGIVVNPCILDIKHECELLIFKSDQIADFDSFDSYMKKLESYNGKHGYDFDKIKN